MTKDNTREAVVRAMDDVLIGGNHLAGILGAGHLPHTVDAVDALEYYGAGDAYDIWCCWRAIMNLRDTQAAIDAYERHRADDGK